MTTNATVYYRDGQGKNAIIKYTGIQCIKAGAARDVLGEDDARGTGIPLNTALIQFIFDDGERATFDADKITVLF